MQKYFKPFIKSLLLIFAVLNLSGAIAATTYTKTSTHPIQVSKKAETTHPKKVKAHVFDMGICSWQPWMCKHQ